MFVKKFHPLSVKIFSGFLPGDKITLKASTRAGPVFVLRGITHATWKTHQYTQANIDTRRSISLMTAYPPNPFAIAGQYPPPNHGFF